MPNRKVSPNRPRGEQRHIENYDNPHRVTAEQLGLYSQKDIDKLISGAVAEARKYTLNRSSTLYDKLNELDTNLNTLEDELDTLDDVINGEGGLNDQLDTLDDQLNGAGGLAEQLTQLDSDLEDLDTALSALDAQINDPNGLSDQLDTLDAEINGAGGLDERLTTAEGDLNTLDGELTTLEGNLNDLDTILGNPPDSATFFSSIVTNQAWINELVANQAWLDNLFVNNAYADRITANEIVANSITTVELDVNQIVANEAFIDSLVTTQLFADEIISNSAFVTNITASNILTDTLLANRISVSELVGRTAWFDEITAANGWFDQIAATELFAQRVVANDFFVDELVADTAWINKLTANEGWFDQLVANQAFYDGIMAQTLQLTGMLTVGDPASIYMADGINTYTEVLTQTYSDTIADDLDVGNNESKTFTATSFQSDRYSVVSFDATWDNADPDRSYIAIQGLKNGNWATITSWDFGTASGTDSLDFVVDSIGYSQIRLYTVGISPQANSLELTNMSAQQYNPILYISNGKIMQKIAPDTVIPLSGSSGSVSSSVNVTWDNLFGKPNTESEWEEETGFDNRYYTQAQLYTQSDINDFFSGNTSITGYNKTNWDNHLSRTDNPHIVTASQINAVPTARELTINGTTYSLTEDRSWTVVDTYLDSVAFDGALSFTMNTGIVTGSPIDFDARYYTKSQLQTNGDSSVHSGNLTNTGVLPFDDYGSWGLQANGGTAEPITNTDTVNIIGNGDIVVTQGGVNNTDITIFYETPTPPTDRYLEDITINGSGQLVGSYNTGVSPVTFSVNLDNRYDQLGHTHTYSEITDFQTGVEAFSDNYNNWDFHIDGSPENLINKGQGLNLLSSDGSVGISISTLGATLAGKYDVDLTVDGFVTGVTSVGGGTSIVKADSGAVTLRSFTSTDNSIDISSNPDTIDLSLAETYVPASGGTFSGGISVLQSYGGSGYSHFAHSSDVSSFTFESIFTKANFDSSSFGIRSTGNKISGIKFLSALDSSSTQGWRIVHANSEATGISEGLHFIQDSDAFVTMRLHNGSAWINGNTVWHQGNLTSNSQLSNGANYIANGDVTFNGTNVNAGQAWRWLGVGDINVNTVGNDISISYTGSFSDTYLDQVNDLTGGNWEFRDNSGALMGSIDVSSYTDPFTASNYVPKTGGTFTSSVTFRDIGNQVRMEDSSDGNKQWRWEVTGNQARLVETGIRVQMTFNEGLGGADINTPLTVQGNTVWHAGNLSNPVETNDNVSFGTGSFSGDISTSNGIVINHSAYDNDSIRIRSTHYGHQYKIWQESSGLKIATYDNGDYSNATNSAIIQFAPNGSVVDVNANLRVNSNTVWHTGNDGDGSGLNADLLDGQHAINFASASHTHGQYYESGDNVSFGTGKFTGVVQIGTTGSPSNWGQLELSGTGAANALAFTGATGGSARIYTTGNEFHITRSGVNDQGISINSAGDVGIKKATSTSYALDISGATRSSGINYASNHVGTSDRILKSQEKPLNAIDIIRNSGELYSYKKEGIEGREVGQFAQDLLHCPDLVGRVKHDKYGEVYTLSGLSVASVAFQGVKQVDDEVTKLRKRVDELEREVNELRRSA